MRALKIFLLSLKLVYIDYDVGKIDAYDITITKLSPNFTLQKKLHFGKPSAVQSTSLQRVGTFYSVCICVCLCRTAEYNSSSLIFEGSELREQWDFCSTLGSDGWFYFMGIVSCVLWIATCVGLSYDTDKIRELGHSD